MEQKEPSMEEILSSIRRILSHEEETTTSQGEEDLKTTVSSSALESAKEDVMELTQDMRVEDEQPKAEVQEEPTATTVPDDMILLSEEAVQASVDRLSHFVDTVSQEKRQSPVANVPANSGSLEDIVSALLRPYLKEWLDANLPALVEKVVKNEVERLTKKIKL